MKTTTNILILLLLAAALIVATSSCNKTATEYIQFPNKVELLVGQYCLPQVILDENETTRTFSDWISSNQDIAITKGDTILALTQGTTEITTKYQDNFGEHSVACTVTVSNPDIPTAEDTIFVHYGDYAELCKFDVPGSYTIKYDLEKGDGSAYPGTLQSIESPYVPSRVIQFSPVYTYYLNTIVPEQGLTSLRIYCEELGFDVTLPIVTLPAEDKGL